MPNIRDRALALFKPDDDGHSDWVEIEFFEAAGLRWSANGNIRRGVAWGLSDIKWDVKRAAGRKVVALRMVGWNDGESFEQTIVPNVRKSFESTVECNLSMLPIPGPDREIDHRYGHKNHPDYVEIYKPENQSVSAFQLVHRVLNLQKRQMCVVCVETQIRPAHPVLGYAEGDETMAERFPCTGCFLAEPERFRSLKG